jgi:hypothetical protein
MARRKEVTPQAIDDVFGRFSQAAVSLSDLNDQLAENDYQRMTPEKAEALGLAVRRRLSIAGRVRNVIVARTREAVDQYWAFSSESFRGTTREQPGAYEVSQGAGGGFSSRVIYYGMDGDVARRLFDREVKFQRKEMQHLRRPVTLRQGDTVLDEYDPASGSFGAGR